MIPKIIGFRPGSKNNSGIILVAVLLILVILSTLAVSLGRGTSIEIALAKHSVGKLKAKYAAWGGLIYAIGQIRRDSENASSKKEDTLFYCGIPRTEDQTPLDLFKEKPLGKGVFNVRYRAGASSKAERSPQNVWYYGLRDEERLLNINGLLPQNLDVFEQLILLLGFDEEEAEVIAASIIDWKDQDDFVLNEPDGAEEDFYSAESPGYHCKNRPFDSKEELLLVRGMSREIFDRLKDYITVFPPQGSLQVNFDTAPELVLRALAHGFAGAKTNTDEEDADSLVEKILDYRAGDDGREFSADDRSVDHNDMPLNAKERTIFLAMSALRTKDSKYLRIRVEGLDKNFGVSSLIDAVLRREDLAIVYWKYQ